jgi:hypothetical protein
MPSDAPPYLAVPSLAVPSLAMPDQAAPGHSALIPARYYETTERPFLLGAKV